jgi:hypothetical protein
MRNALLAGLVILTLLGCSSKKEAEEEPSIDISPGQRVGNIIMPLEIGNMWVYNVYGIDTAQKQLRPILVDTLSVISDTVINSERWFYMAGLQGTEGWVQNRKDGFWFALPGAQPFLFAAYPAQPGDTFTSLIGKSTAHTTVAGTGVEVKSPAGTDYCYKYVQKVAPVNATTNYYFAPGVGLVKMEIMDRSGQQPMAMDLLNEVNLINRQKALQQKYLKEHSGDSAGDGK